MRFAALLATLLTVAAPVSAALFRVWVHQDAVQLGYKLSEREAARTKLRNQLRQLEVELAAEKAPARLSQLAKKLSLVPPANSQVVGGPTLSNTTTKGAAHGRP